MGESNKRLSGRMTQSLLSSRIPLLALFATAIVVVVAAIASTGSPDLTLNTSASTEALLAVEPGQEVTASLDDALFAGDFNRKDGPASITGEAVVVTDASGDLILRLSENFRIDRGRAQVVVLRSAEGETVTLGALQSVGGEQDYQLPADTDLTVWDEVVIWDDELNFAYGNAFLEVVE